MTAPNLLSVSSATKPVENQRVRTLNPELAQSPAYRIGWMEGKLAVQKQMKERQQAIEKETETIRKLYREVFRLSADVNLTVERINSAEKMTSSLQDQASRLMERVRDMTCQADGAASMSEEALEQVQGLVKEFSDIKAIVEARLVEEKSLVETRNRDQARLLELSGQLRQFIQQGMEVEARLKHRETGITKSLLASDEALSGVATALEEQKSGQRRLEVLEQRTAALLDDCRSQLTGVEEQRQHGERAWEQVSRLSADIEHLAGQTARQVLRWQEDYRQWESASEGTMQRMDTIAAEAMAARADWQTLVDQQQAFSVRLDQQARAQEDLLAQSAERLGEARALMVRIQESEARTAALFEQSRLVMDKATEVQLVTADALDLLVKEKQVISAEREQITGIRQSWDEDSRKLWEEWKQEAARQNEEWQARVAAQRYEVTGVVSRHHAEMTELVETVGNKWSDQISAHDMAVKELVESHDEAMATLVNRKEQEWSDLSSRHLQDQADWLQARELLLDDQQRSGELVERCENSVARVDAALIEVKAVQERHELLTRDTEATWREVRDNSFRVAVQLQEASEREQAIREEMAREYDELAQAKDGITNLLAQVEAQRTREEQLMLQLQTQMEHGQGLESLIQRQTELLHEAEGRQRGLALLLRKAEEGQKRLAEQLGVHEKQAKQWAVSLQQLGQQLKEAQLLNRELKLAGQESRMAAEENRRDQETSRRDRQRLESRLQDMEARLEEMVMLVEESQSQATSTPWRAEMDRMKEQLLELRIEEDRTKTSVDSLRQVAELSLRHMEEASRRPMAETSVNAAALDKEKQRKSLIRTMFT